MIKAAKEIGVTRLMKFSIWSILQLILSLMFLPPMRTFLLKLYGATSGKNSVIMKVKFFNWHHLGFKGFNIGNDCFIGDETLIDLYGPVELGNNVTVAQRVTILTHINVGYKSHPLQKQFPKKIAGVSFKSGSVIGAASVILPGVSIGNKSFVAAGSVVTKNVPPNTLVAGVPAKVIRKIK